MKRQPKLFKLISSKGCKLFKKLLDPRKDRRPKNVTELNKFLDDRWLGKGAEKEMAENEPDELCPSMYSFHSSPEEKDKLLYDLAKAGIETTVDRTAKKARIRDWIETSVIAEEDEDDDTPIDFIPNRAPVAGHISSIRGPDYARVIHSTVKDSSRKHIDPRTGEIQVGPSEMIRHSSQPELEESNSSGGSTTCAGPDSMSSMQFSVNGRLEFKLGNANGNPTRKTLGGAKMDSENSSHEKCLPNTSLPIHTSNDLDISSSFSSSKDPSPSELTDNDSPRGSIGFVTTNNNNHITRKDTAYDRIKIIAGARK